MLLVQDKLPADARTTARECINGTAAKWCLGTSEERVWLSAPYSNPWIYKKALHNTVKKESGIFVLTAVVTDSRTADFCAQPERLCPPPQA